MTKLTNDYKKKSKRAKCEQVSILCARASVETESQRELLEHRRRRRRRRTVATKRDTHTNTEGVTHIFVREEEKENVGKRIYVDDDESESKRYHESAQQNDSTKKRD